MDVFRHRYLINLFEQTLKELMTGGLGEEEELKLLVENY